MSSNLPAGYNDDYGDTTWADQDCPACGHAVAYDVAGGPCEDCGAEWEPGDYPVYQHDRSNDYDEGY